MDAATAGGRFIAGRFSVAGRRLLSTNKVSFVDAERKLFLYVHTEGAWCGQKVRGGHISVGFRSRPQLFRCSGHNLRPQRAHFGAGGHISVGFCSRPLLFRCLGHDLLPQRAHWDAGGHISMRFCAREAESVREDETYFYSIIIILYVRRILLGVPEYILLRHHRVFGRDNIYI